ncbi:cytochrome P450 6a2-like isoform X2 [Anoplophora glabripennis]|uniref:cytochrome P450 6a2-like isoform X2 n=1 Tax=Anoplophora glabripennis TaxID=217634 RepID=UPI0008734F3E|nr:cytochrome P450 6a2-like isoform X2 [Anoplophora glabripennis]
MTLLTENPVHDLFLVVTTVLVLIYPFFHRSYQYWKNRNFPYLEPTFPLGNSPYLFTSTMGFGLDTVKYYDEMKKKGYKFGGIYTITSPALVLVNPDYVRDVLTKDFHYFIDRGHYYNERDDPISAHLFALNEKTWKNMRTKLTPTFTSGKMKMMFHTVLETSKYMTDAIETSALERKDIDIREFLSCFTTDVIGSCAFGIECNSFKGTEAEFRHMGREIFEVRGLRILNLILISKMPRLALKLGLKATNDHVSKFFYEAVQKTVKYREDNNFTRPDFLQLLIDIKNQTKGTDNPFTMDQLVSQVFLFFVAGFDTSSSTMNFALYELCKHQDVQDRVREEVNEVLERHGGQFTYESIGELKYLQQVIDEAQRLFPPLVVLTRVCVKDYKLRDTDLVLEKGTRVVIPLYSIHRDPEYYPEPDKFDPERFNNENKKSRHPFVHLPFGEGPRNCIGLRFGLMQSKIGLATILSKFRLRISPKTDMPLRLHEGVLLLKSVNKLYVTAEKI